MPVCAFQVSVRAHESARGRVHARPHPRAHPLILHTPHTPPSHPPSPPHLSHPPWVQAIDSLVRVQAELIDYSVNSGEAVGQDLTPLGSFKGSFKAHTRALMHARSRLLSPPPTPAHPPTHPPTHQPTTHTHPPNAVTEGIEALANTRVVIRPAGKMADKGYVSSYKVGGWV